MTITASGTTSEPSMLRVFVQQGAGGCSGGDGAPGANADRQRGRSGSVEVITRQPSGAFAYSAQYTPPVAGPYAICAHLFRTTPTSSVSSQVSKGFAVAQAPPAVPGAAPAPGPGATGTPGAPGAAGTTPGVTSTTRAKRCVVPRLKGRTYTEARRRIHRAGCIVGEVVKPNKRLRRPVRPGGRTRILKVVYQRPKAGTVLRPRGRVTLQLKYYTPKTPKKR